MILDILSENGLLATRISVLLLSLFLLGYLIFSGKLSAFFKSPGSAINLAIFRIVFYGFVSIGIQAPLFLLGLKTIDFAWADLPETARVSIPFMGWYVYHLPITTGLATFSVQVIAATSFLCMIGFRPRIFGWIFLAATFYYTGIPNFFGKINHNHYIIWFASILPLSRCADALSLDNWLHRKGILKLKKFDSPHDPRYGTPLHFVMLLIGIIYFFPGFYKVWNSGSDWIFSDNLRNQFYMKWIELGGWKPFFRIDLYPFLYKAAALLTVLFELFFIFLIFFKKGKWLAVVSGVFFHVATWIFMHINFLYLLMCYVVFVDWENLFARLGYFKKPAKPGSVAIPIMKNNPSLFMGISLLSINIFFGVFDINSWPFSVFPKFDRVVPSQTAVLSYFKGSETGELTELDKSWLLKKYTPYIYREWEHRVINFYKNKDAKDLEQELNMLSNVWLPHLSDETDSFFIYYQVISLTPDSFRAEKSQKLWSVGLKP